MQQDQANQKTAEAIVDQIRAIRQTFENHMEAEREARTEQRDLTKAIREKIEFTQRLAGSSIFWSTGAFVIACVSLLAHAC